MEENSPPTIPLPESLLQSARAEFLARGFAEANVGRIAAAAGMSKKTVYKYVPSKEALLFAVMRSVVSGPGLALGTTDASAPPEIYLALYLKAFATIAFSDEGVTSYRLMMSEGTRFPDFARIYVESVKRFGIQPLADQLAAYANAGRLAIPDAGRSATMLISMVVADVLRDAALGLASPPMESELEEFLADVIHVFLCGVAQRKHR